MVKVMTPGKSDAVSIRHIPATQEDRAEQVKNFRKRKNEEQKIKEERFDKIKERRKNRPPAGGPKGGINIEVTSDS